MHAKFPISLMLFLLAVGSVDANPLDINRHFIMAANSAKPSVVNIIIYKSSPGRGEHQISRVAYGSGTIISRTGYLVTNYHVVRKGNFYRAILHDGTECDLKLLSGNRYYLADEKTDIAVMKLAGTEGGDYVPITMEDSDELSEGEWVIAIGNPYGLRQSITSGIVSSKGRNDLGFADVEDFIQTDVPINPGNSGGPLINLQGRMVGLNTAIRTVSGGYQGISFAIPSNIVKRVSSELIRNGRVRRGWMGFLVRERKVSRKSEKSLLEVISVIKDSPAEDAGIHRGDVIRYVDDREVGSLGELVSTVARKEIGTRLKITVSRSGRLHDFQLLWREKIYYQKIQRGLKTIYTHYGIEMDENASTGEVVITYLSPMRSGYRSGLKKGDVIVSLNGKKVSTLESLVMKAKAGGYRIENLNIRRGDTLYGIDLREEE